MTWIQGAYLTQGTWLIRHDLLEFSMLHVRAKNVWCARLKLQIAKAAALKSRSKVLGNSADALPPPVQSSLLRGRQKSGPPGHKKSERIRVGLVSADFRLKATAYLVYDL